MENLLRVVPIGRVVYWQAPIMNVILVYYVIPVLRLSFLRMQESPAYIGFFKVNRITNNEIPAFVGMT